MRTNLIFRNELIQFGEAAKQSPFRRGFAMALHDQLYGSTAEETRFTSFVDALSAGSCAKWTIATYFVFLNSKGKTMFMKPAVVKKMADSLNIALNYQSFPNWLTFCKLQELASRVETELRARGLKPKSGIDTQGFIWSSIRIEEGKYDKD